MLEALRKLFSSEPALLAALEHAESVEAKHAENGDVAKSKDTPDTVVEVVEEKAKPDEKDMELDTSLTDDDVARIAKAVAQALAPMFKSQDTPPPVPSVEEVVEDPSPEMKGIADALTRIAERLKSQDAILAALTEEQPESKLAPVGKTQQAPLTPEQAIAAWLK